jgi:hypothetical protein
MSHALSQEMLSCTSFAGALVRAPMSTSRASALTLACTEAQGAKAEEGRSRFAPCVERMRFPGTLRQLVSCVASAGSGLAFRRERQMSFAFSVGHVALGSCRKAAVAVAALPNTTVERTSRIRPREAAHLRR